MLITLVVVGVLLAARCGAVERFPNARYLGMGYNAIMGNPDNDLNDPGFAFSVLQFTWETSTTTSDGKYYVPDNIQALQTKSCGFESHAATDFGSQSYQNSLSVDVSVEVEGGLELWSGRFTASVGYKKVNQGTSEHRRFYTSARAKCIEYQLSVDYLNAPIGVTTNFAEAVSSLPLVQNGNAYNTFINTYGTHFTGRVTMGAKMVIRSEFDEKNLTRMEEVGLNVETGTKLSFTRAAAGISTETKSEREQREKFESTRRSYSSSYLGSRPPTDGRWETWAQSAGNSPYPVRYRLAPITSLLTDKFFPDMPSSELSTRRSLLAAAYASYCSGISGCGTPPPDRVPVRMKKAVSRILGTATVSCPPTYELLSCGILNVRNSGSYDKRRYAIPASTSSCECHDNAEVKCVSWCTNTAVQYTTATSLLVQYFITTATCPSGYKVQYMICTSGVVRVLFDT